MKRFLTFAFLLFTSFVWAAGPPGGVTLPITINAGTTITPDFFIPNNVKGGLTITIPCDPAWIITFNIQQSTDGGATWDCDVVKIPCTRYGHKGSCAAENPNIIAKWIRGVPFSPKNKMRLHIVSNITKTTTIQMVFE
jgi:hypothetical protein